MTLNHFQQQGVASVTLYFDLKRLYFLVDLTHSISILQYFQGNLTIKLSHLGGSESRGGKLCLGSSSKAEGAKS